jgi:hypothetical protein
MPISIKSITYQPNGPKPSLVLDLSFPREMSRKSAEYRLYSLLKYASGFSRSRVSANSDVDSSQDIYRFTFSGISKVRFICFFLMSKYHQKSSIISVSQQLSEDLARIFQALPVKAQARQAVSHRALKPVASADAHAEKSVHSVKLVEFEGEQWFFKSFFEMHGNRKLSEFDAAISQLVWVMVGNHHAPLCRPVYNSTGQRLGVISKALPGFVPFVRESRLWESNPGEQVTWPEVHRRMLAAGFMTLATADYFVGDSDRHTQNFGFVDIDGKRKMAGIDRDKALPDLMFPYHYEGGAVELDLVQRKHFGAANFQNPLRYRYSDDNNQPCSEDIVTFPILRKAEPLWWYDRTTREGLSLINFEPTESFNREKYFYFVSHLILSRLSVEHIADEFIASPKGRTRFKQAVTERCQRIEEALLQTPQAWYAMLRYHQEGRWLDRIKKRAAKRAASASWKTPFTVCDDDIEARFNTMIETARKYHLGCWCANIKFVIGEAFSLDDLDEKVKLHLLGSPGYLGSLTEKFYFELFFQKRREALASSGTGEALTQLRIQLLEQLEHAFKDSFPEKPLDDGKFLTQALAPINIMMEVAEDVFSVKFSDVLNILQCSQDALGYPISDDDRRALSLTLYQIFFAKVSERGLRCYDVNVQDLVGRIDELLTQLRVHPLPEYFQKPRDEFVAVFERILKYQAGNDGHIPEQKFEQVLKLADVLLNTCAFLQSPETNARSFANCINSVLKDKQLQIPFHYKFGLAGALCSLLAVGLVAIAVTSYMTFAGVPTLFTALAISNWVFAMPGAISAVGSLASSGGAIGFFRAASDKVLKFQKPMSAIQAAADTSTSLAG